MSAEFPYKTPNVVVPQTSFGEAYGMNLNPKLPGLIKVEAAPCSITGIEIPEFDALSAPVCIIVDSQGTRPSADLPPIENQKYLSDDLPTPTTRYGRGFIAPGAQISNISGFAAGGLAFLVGGLTYYLRQRRLDGTLPTKESILSGIRTLTARVGSLIT